MDPNPLALARLLIPKIPFILRTLLTNRLGWSPCSDKQDAQTEIVVEIVRSMFRSQKPVGELQAGTTRDPGIKGAVWIAKVACEVSDTDANFVRDLVMRAVKELGDGTEKVDLPELNDVGVDGEWTGYRAGVAKNAPRPVLAGGEKEHYTSLMKETTTPVTILYFHGGAYFLLDPCSHRALTSGLAKRTGGRCFSVRYRLAPRHAFPAQLIDALTAYLYLLSPPPDAFHDPIPASHIVFAGDSAGGNLAFALALLLLTLRRMGINSIPFHGRDVPLDLPAGISGNSPWLDIGRCMPSINNNAKYDYLDPPAPSGLPIRSPAPDHLWPTTPPRAEIFCGATLLCHPLVAPLAASTEMWKDMPPVFICVGSGEGLEDEGTVVARRIWEVGGIVDFVLWEGQPHCFAMIFPTTIAGKECLGLWADFCRGVVVEPQTVKRTDSGRFGRAFAREKVVFERIGIEGMGVEDRVVEGRMREMKRVAVEREEVDVREFERGMGKSRL